MDWDDLYASKDKGIVPKMPWKIFDVIITQIYNQLKVNNEEIEVAINVNNKTTSVTIFRMACIVMSRGRFLPLFMVVYTASFGFFCVLWHWKDKFYIS